MLNFTCLGESSQVITEGDDIVVSNTKYERDRIYFKISPRPDKFLTGFIHSGGTRVVYDIRPFQRNLIL
jgi:hypothetical protein